MNVVNSSNYLSQFKKIIDKLISEDAESAKQFKLYIDTIVLNSPTKLKKYKQSHYFEDENIKYIHHEGYTITFYIDEENDVSVLLGIVKNY